MSRGIDKGSSLPLLPITVDVKSGQNKSGPTTPHANGHHELPAWHSIGTLAVTMSTRTSPKESERVSKRKWRLGFHDNIAARMLVIGRIGSTIERECT